jgi:hypothetical protein
MIYVIQVCRQLASRIRVEQNQLYALISQIYSTNETPHISDSSSVHHQEFFTVHTAVIYVIKLCRHLASRIRVEQNQLDALISQIYCTNETPHISDSSSFHHQELFTVHPAMVYVLHLCSQLTSRIRMELQFHPYLARKLSTNLYDIYHSCVYSTKLLMMNRGTVRNM